MSHVALLRGINVGGKHMLPMAKVRETFEAAGARSVSSYIQSGNVIFSHPAKSDTLCPKLAAALTKAAGFPVPVVMRSDVEWTALIKANPFRSETVHCAFLPVAPDATALAKIAAIEAKTFLPSKFVVANCEIYFDLPDGVGNDKLVGTVLRAFPDATIRNWRTVVRLDEMLRELVAGRTM